MKSIRERRREKVKILVPIYKDVNTDMGDINNGPSEEAKMNFEKEPFPG